LTSSRSVSRSAEALFDEAERRLRRLRLAPAESRPFRVELPGGEARQFGVGEPAFTLIANDAQGAAALSSFDDLAVAEAYLHDHLDVRGDLYAMLAYRSMLSDRRPLQYLWETYLQPLVLGQVDADKKTIPGHYDLPPEFFTLWLDQRLRAYSHAFFERDDETLEEGMERKFQFAIDACGVKPGEHVLDIGGGWGSLVEFAGRRNIRVTSVTISRESAAFMRELIRRHSLPAEVIEEHLLEYRPNRRFDAIINLGVTEHLPDYRGTLAQYDRLLEANRHVYLDAYSGPRFSMSSWVTKWVYEGNTSPLCLGRYFSELERTDFEVLLLQDDRHNYELTCRKWAERLEAAHSEIAHRWGELLYRRFRLYLWGCARCFADGQLGAHHMVLRRRPGLRASRRLFQF
jgi:cyclopropane-fatty-acyl-phospholipid synthase